MTARSAGPRSERVAGYAVPLAAIDDLRVTEHEGQLLLSADKLIEAGDAYLAAHFPGRTIYPGVFVLETVQQAVIEALGERNGMLPDLVEVRSLRFVSAVRPGQRLCLEAVAGPGTAAGLVPVEARCRRADGTDVAVLKLSFRYPGGLDE